MDDDGICDCCDDDTDCDCSCHDDDESSLYDGDVCDFDSDDSIDFGDSGGIAT